MISFFRGTVFTLELEKQEIIKYNLIDTEYKIYNFFWYTFAYDFENL